MCELDENLGILKLNVDFSDIFDEEKDEFDDVLNEVNGDIDIDCDNLFDELVECFGIEDKCGEVIYEKFFKVINDGVWVVVDLEKLMKWVKNIIDWRMCKIWLF